MHLLGGPAGSSSTVYSLMTFAWFSFFSTAISAVGPAFTLI